MSVAMLTANGDDVMEVFVVFLFCLKLYLMNKKLHPGKLTWNLKITCLKRKIIFQTSIFGFHVNFQGCKWTDYIYVYIYIYNLQVWAPFFQMQGLLKMSTA